MYLSKHFSKLCIYLFIFSGRLQIVYVYTRHIDNETLSRISLKLNGRGQKQPAKLTIFWLNANLNCSHV